jgi:WD40 repeat protein
VIRDCDVVLSLAIDATGLCGVLCGPVKTLVWFQLDPTHSVDVKVRCLLHHILLVCAQDAACECLPEQPSMTTVDETKLPHTGVSTVAYRPDGKIVASSGWDGKLRVYHASKHTPLAVLNAHAGTAHSLAFGKPSEAEVFGCGGVFASAGKDGRIVVYSVFPPSSRTPSRE